jgi:hypothetical protein
LAVPPKQPAAATSAQASEDGLEGASRGGPPLRSSSSSSSVQQLETELDARDAKIARLEMEKAELIASLRTKVVSQDDTAVGIVSPSAPSEFDRISPLVNAPLQPRAIYYLITSRWYAAWLQWVGHPGEQTMHMEAPRVQTRAVRPGPIDNSEFLEVSMQGSRTDFVAVPPAAWEMLRAWYGGGPPIKRRAIAGQNGAVSVSFQGLRLYVYRSSDIQGDPVLTVEPTSTTVRELKASVCEDYGLDPQKVRIWDFYTKTLFEFLEHSLDKTLECCRILNTSPILLEEQIDEETWPYADPHQAEGIGFF